MHICISSLNLILWNLCEKINEGEAESFLTLVLVLSRFLSDKYFLRIYASRLVSSLFIIIFNDWEKTVIRLVFLYVRAIWTVKYCTKTWHFQILNSFFTLLLCFTVYILSCFLLQHLCLIVHHNGVKNIHVRKAKCVTWYRNRE